MNDKEAELVTEEFVKEDTNYNLCPGGHGGFGYINSTSTVRNGFEKTMATFKQTGDSLIWAKMGGASYTRKIKTDIEFRNLVAEKNRQNSKKYPNGFLNKKHTEETKRKIGSKNSFSQKGQKNSQYGTIWIYSPEEKRSKKIDKNQPIPEGWFKGRKFKF